MMSILMPAILAVQLMAMPPLAPFPLPNPGGPANPFPMITVLVQDPDGKPVPDASVMVRAEGHRSSHSAMARTGQNGESQVPVVFFRPNQPEPEKAYVTAWTDAYAYGIEDLDLEEIKSGSQSVTVSLAKGRETEVRITMPDGTMAPADLGLSAMEILTEPQNLSLSRGPARSSAGSFWFVTSDDTETLHLRTQEESRFIGWIQQVSTVDGPQSFQLPATGGLQVSFRQDRDGEGFMVIDRVIEQTDSTGSQRSTSTHTVLQINGDGEQIEFEIPYLHPGKYDVSVGTGKHEQMWSRQIAYGAKKQTVVVGGETSKLEFREGDHDLSVFDGNTNFEIQLEDGTGPASGVAWRLNGPHPGTLVQHRQRVLAREGVTGADGIVRIENINLEPLGYAHQSFELTLADGTRLGDINPIEVLRSANMPQRFVVPARQGDPVADALITRVTDGREVRLSEWEGRVLAIVLWSAFQHADQCIATVDEWDVIAARESSRWGNRVAMVAVNTDSSLSEPLRKLHERAWHSLDHYWAERPQTGQQSDIMRSLDAANQPWVVILDAQRRVVVSGLARDVDVEEEIGKLME